MASDGGLVGAGGGAVFVQETSLRSVTRIHELVRFKNQG